MAGDIAMNYQIITGDCLDWMAEYEGVGIDCVVTDPPYGIDFRGKAWDAEIPPWLEPARLVAPVVVFTTAPVTQWDYPRPNWVGCWYRPASNSRSLLGGLCHWSPILFYGKPRVGLDTISIHAMSWGRDPEEHGHHPTPKPVRLMRWIIEYCTAPGGTILDPFCGSGTTGVACIETGRNFIGIEINPEYADIARARCEKAERQPDLFVKPPKPVQETLL